MCSLNETCHATTQVSKYRKVAQKLAGLLQRTLSSCFASWRAATDQARVNALRAQRHAHTRLLMRLLPAWADAAAELHDQRLADEATADKLQRRVLLARACGGWREEVQVLHEQRQGLWRLLLMLLGRERRELLQAGLGAWQGWAQDRVALRSMIAAFVNKRRLACLSEYLTLWHQYTTAMRGGGGGDSDGSAGGGDCARSPAGTPGLLHALGHLPSAGAAAAARSRSPGPQGYESYTYRPPTASTQAGCLVPGGSRPGSPTATGVLPVTGGPDSPLLGPRSAHQDRHMARRLAAMGGAAAEVSGRVAECWVL
jgi:hypothetical protein